jgi:hypothetical protein
VRQDGDLLFFKLSVFGEYYEISFDIPSGAILKCENGGYYVLTKGGERVFPNMTAVQLKLHAEGVRLGFEVKYIGQAYGKDGSRNALDRLLKHETLQKISLSGVKDGYRLDVLLLEIQPDNRIITLFNPFALNQEDTSARIENGSAKLFDTSEIERITLYEASMIRYFQPKYNREFKDSFPSTNMKVLKDCYDKDFSAVVAEICIDDLPFDLFSEFIEMAPYHVVRHNLHEGREREMFFS